MKMIVTRDGEGIRGAFNENMQKQLSRCFVTFEFAFPVVSSPVIPNGIKYSKPHLLQQLNGSPFAMPFN